MGSGRYYCHHFRLALALPLAIALEHLWHTLRFPLHEATCTLRHTAQSLEPVAQPIIVSLSAAASGPRVGSCTPTVRSQRSNRQSADRSVVS